MPKTAPSSYTQQLLANQVDPTELQGVLQEFYRSSTGVDEDSWGYSREQGDAPALIVRFTSKGQVTDIEPGPTFDPSDIAQLADEIRSKLIDDGRWVIARKIMFAAVPVDGHFRYEDRFQLMQVPPEAPRPDFLFAPHPFILEARFRHSSATWVRLRRQKKALREVELICAALLSPRVWGSSDRLQYHWVRIEGGEDDATSLLQEQYAWPGKKPGWDESFTSAGSTPPLPVVDHGEYYRHAAIIAGQSLSVPSTFARSLAAYYGLQDDARERFQAACYWVLQGWNQWDTSRSQAFVALVSAIEALTVPASRTACEACGKPLGPGATQQFVDFIEKFVSEQNDTRATQKMLYQLRSKISHGNLILHADRAEWIWSHPYSREDASSYRLLKTVRRAIVNWLLAQAEPEEASARL